MDFSHITPICKEPYPYTELQERCLRDLETTEEMQGAYRLEKRTGFASQFCCLGRFCIVADVPRYPNAFDSIIAFGDPDGYIAGLPDKLASELKLSTLGELKRLIEVNGTPYSSLVNMNDSGEFSFKDIAAYIRHDPWNVFTDELPVIMAA